ncbi:T-cell surface antigen CD2-like isoform X1 [Haplochromis burtoni]|uniref:T-cell surface antigen CD2-like isoform X1 n=2 Tax=Haplochromis burtoni TaxID=8153 RepID=UPI001C2D3CA2|nr:T-cell surface antigen CD2-like isoform X1 [Haplochromis burtoni]XP_042069326.1 T-cell surface antigen CD2-like isoform X1 [Haplochromis burtoni]XP_042069329.1 T-cell surface antigen CD2-like isoform X1 [Haplochromis burtoni]XP_042069330.1 T-cell surface antigen CD2-like isoform X1 [Haplochromis burtoni]
MEAVLGLMIVLLGVAQGVETYCDGRQDGAQCYGALGGTVDIQLMDSTSEISRYHLLKDSLKILDVKHNKSFHDTTENKFLFFPSNGTFRISSLNRNEHGNYTLQTFDSDGRKSDEWTFKLIFQAPVSSVLLLSECLSQGEMRVSCSSQGGDSPQYSWTLDGRTLTDAELLSGNNKSNNIILKQHVSGHLVCSVRNHVNSVSKEQRICTCGFIFINCTLSDGTHITKWVLATKNTLCIKPTMGPIKVSDTPLDNSLLLCGLRAVMGILLLIGIFIYFAWKKKKTLKAEVSAVPQTMDYPDNSVLMVEMRSSTSCNV